MINIHHAKTQFSKLLARVQSGEEIIIARAGVPIAKLIGYRTEERIPDIDCGRIIVADDFGVTSSEVISSFEDSAL